MEKVEKKGQATNEQIAAWKEKHGDILSVEADGHVAYFRKPTRQELGYAMTLQSESLKMTEVMLKQCKIGGSDIFLDETDYMLGAVSVIEQLVTAKATEIKKL